MKKYKLKVTHSRITALQQWLMAAVLKPTTIGQQYEQIAIMIILLKWARSEQVRNLCDFHFAGEKSISLKQEVAAALAAVIAQTEIDNTSYLGNYLRTVLGEIDQHFN